jgi:hypothetical protein
VIVYASTIVVTADVRVAYAVSSNKLGRVEVRIFVTRTEVESSRAFYYVGSIKEGDFICTAKSRLMTLIGH